MSENLRLTNFKPERIAPNFTSFLKRAGEVSFGEDIEQTARFGFIEKGLLNGISKAVKLNGEPIGRIECYINPPGVVFKGELPAELARPRRLSKEEKANPPKTRKVVVSYHGKHPLAHKIGRMDGWNKIPFP